MCSVYFKIFGDHTGTRPTQTPHLIWPAKISTKAKQVSITKTVSGTHSRKVKYFSLDIYTLIDTHSVLHKIIKLVAFNSIPFLIHSWCVKYFFSCWILDVAFQLYPTGEPCTFHEHIIA